MSSNNSVRANELLKMSKRVNEELEQIKSNKTDDDFDMGVKEGQRMALQGIHDSIMRRLGFLLGGR